MSPAALNILPAAQRCGGHLRSDAQVAGDQHGAVHDVEAAGGVAGGERRVARDHDQLVAALRQLPQRRLALCLLPQTWFNILPTNSKIKHVMTEILVLPQRRLALCGATEQGISERSRA